MPDLQSPAPAHRAPAMLDSAPAMEDQDYALGCECADPALQIPQWGQEARAGSAEDA